MTKTFYRRELYDLVWTDPVSIVAKALGISDVGLKKACQRADIPVPIRGYWAKKKAGKRTQQIPLSLRFPGASDTVTIGQQHYFHGPNWRADILAEPIPPVPVFEEDMSAVEARIKTLVGKVTCPPTTSNTHRLIQPLLDQDRSTRPACAVLR